MKKAFNLIEVMLVIMILGVTFRALPEILAVANKSTELSLQEQLIQKNYSKIQLVLSSAWDEINAQEMFDFNITNQAMSQNRKSFYSALGVEYNTMDHEKNFYHCDRLSTDSNINKNKGNRYGHYNYDTTGLRRSCMQESNFKANSKSGPFKDAFDFLSTKEGKDYNYTFMIKHFLEENEASLGAANAVSKVTNVDSKGMLIFNEQEIAKTMNYIASAGSQPIMFNDLDDYHNTDDTDPDHKKHDDCQITDDDKDGLFDGFIFNNQHYCTSITLSYIDFNITKVNNSDSSKRYNQAIETIKIPTISKPIGHIKRINIQIKNADTNSIITDLSYFAYNIGTTRRFVKINPSR